jgi:hypothetical protein
MRIRTTTGPGASPPPGPIKNSNNPTTPQGMGTRAPGVRLAEGHPATPPLRPMMPIMMITLFAGGGDQW